MSFTSGIATSPPTVIYMGKDKHENEDLIKYAWPQDVWFHVDKLSSAHVYLRMPDGMSWEAIPEALLTDCAQLVKANSIEGNKKDNITIIYTPGDNLKKSGDMAVGQVSFHSDKRVGSIALRCALHHIDIPHEQVKRVHVPKRENVIVNRLNKTKVEREVDHENEKVERIKKENATKRAAAAAKKKADAELAKAREAEKAARSYDNLFSGDDDEIPEPKRSVQEMMDDFM
ncbi:Coiled-coil domain-containing protein 25 [Trametes pubescens]|uniref:Coiled-coil domain-containing protein 25 n=1 Tax=Trametes pubescens TaxID=154538 RepID=A0A1M2VZF3_TRAPU|nr:Coiled-coil domain-containing protein 25 [Trametes pubescens]